MIVHEGPNSPTDEQDQMFISVEELARKSNMSREFILTHCRKNNPKTPTLDAYLLGGKYRFSVTDCERWLAEMKLRRS